MDETTPLLVDANGNPIIPAEAAEARLRQMSPTEATAMLLAILRYIVLTGGVEAVQLISIYAKEIEQQITEGDGAEVTE